MSIELKQYKILGYTTDFNKCDCCGKENLKGTVAILDLIYDVVLHFGTSCAAATEKYDSLEAAKQAKKEITKKVNHYKQIERSCYHMAYGSAECKEIAKRKNLYTIKNYNPLNKPVYCMDDPEYVEAYQNSFNRLLSLNLENLRKLQLYAAAQK